MKSEIALLFSLLTLGLIIGAVLATDPIETGVGATITIGMPSSTTTSTSAPISIDNPANITFRLYGKDEIFNQYQTLNITLYDNVGGEFLNSTQVTSPSYLFSPSSLVDLEFTYNSNLDVRVNGLNLTNLNGASSQMLVTPIQSSNAQIPGVTVYRVYKVELPTTFSFNSILLKINLADISGINYNNITVYRCASYVIASNTCSDGWVAQTVNVDSANKFVLLNINHFSVYAVGSGSGGTTSQTTTTTSTITSTTSTSNPPASNPAPVSSDGGGGGGAAFIPPVTTTTTSAPTSTTTVLIIKKNSTTSSSASETTTLPPISGLLGLTGQFSPVLIVAVIIVASVVAIPFIKSNYSFSRINPFRRSYHTFPTRRIKKVKGKKNTELQLSL
jgi:hypothetical protein